MARILLDIFLYTLETKLQMSSLPAFHADCLQLWMIQSSNDLYPRDPKLRKINTVILSSVQLSLRNNNIKEFHAKIRHLRNDQVKRSACTWSDKVYRYTYACLSCNFVSLSPLKKIKNILYVSTQTELHCMRIQSNISTSFTSRLLCFVVRHVDFCVKLRSQTLYPVFWT